MRVLLDIVRQSLATLWAHKLRSFLTMFGIAWGVGSLLLLVGLGEGFRSGQERNMATLGQDIMFLFPGRIPAVEGSLVSGRSYTFTYGDYLAIKDEAKSLRTISPVINREDIRAVSDYGSTAGQVFGVAPEYNKIRTVPVNPGRWFNEEDNKEHRRVAVVGWELLKNVFPGRPAVGASILLNGVSFDVIGVVEKVGPEGGYGKYVRLKHNNGYETAYGHMSAFAKGMEIGKRVRQGQVIGFVGSTGQSTGPHVHYEILVNGRFVDPMRIKLPRGRSLEGPLMGSFEKERDRMDSMMSGRGGTARVSDAGPLQMQTSSR